MDDLIKALDKEYEDFLTRRGRRSNCRLTVDQEHALKIARSFNIDEGIRRYFALRDSSVPLNLNFTQSKIPATARDFEEERALENELNRSLPNPYLAFCRIQRDGQGDYVYLMIACVQGLESFELDGVPAIEVRASSDKSFLFKTFGDLDRNIAFVDTNPRRRLTPEKSLNDYIRYIRGRPKFFAALVRAYNLALKNDSCTVYDSIYDFSLHEREHLKWGFYIDHFVNLMVPEDFHNDFWHKGLNEVVPMMTEIAHGRMPYLHIALAITEISSERYIPSYHRIGQKVLLRLLAERIDGRDHLSHESYDPNYIRQLREASVEVREGLYKTRKELTQQN